MQSFLALLLALILLLTGCGTTVTEVIPGESEATEEEVWAPETSEEKLAYAFAALTEFTALEGEESLTFTGTLGGEPLQYSQSEFFNTTGVDTKSVTYYREVDWSSLVGEEAMESSYSVSYESSSLVSRFDSGTKETQKVTADALSKNIRAAMTARIDADAAAHYTVLRQSEDGSEITFTADENWILDMLDTGLVLLGTGYELDLNGSLGQAEKTAGEVPVCRALLTEAGELRLLELETGEQTFLTEDGTELCCSACYRLRIVSREDAVVPYIPGFT